MSDNSISSEYPLDSGKVVSVDDDDGEMDELVAAYDRATDADYLKFEEAVGLIELRAELALAKIAAETATAYADKLHEPRKPYSEEACAAIDELEKRFEDEDVDLVSATFNARWVDRVERAEQERDEARKWSRAWKSLAKREWGMHEAWEMLTDQLWRKMDDLGIPRQMIDTYWPDHPREVTDSFMGRMEKTGQKLAAAEARAASLEAQLEQAADMRRELWGALVWVRTAGNFMTPEWFAEMEAKLNALSPAPAPGDETETR